jgi:ATP-dependent RNA helicase SUPV3L1/SUV3
MTAPYPNLHKSAELSKLTAVLGPTNTGKTHLAVERMCAHSTGMIGFPLRLLAREVYDRVVSLKGEAQVALITGEEKIIPPDARYFLCTAESMPLERDVSFLAIDEAQMGADDERGHIFTDRLLNARGRDETMILGSDTLRPLVRMLLPKAEIISRPRFSTLSYVPPKKLSRLPKRSAIVAFSAEEVYAIAEMLRRQRGGAAVVMGSLSPRTRNAQVALYQSGEVDYLVATDAIGMGLNMDITHVAFAGLSKFDGKRRRRLRPAELGQIAGRAGRHQRDGTFGVVQLNETYQASFEAEEALALESHTYQPLDSLKWRNSDLNFYTVPGLLRSLEIRPDRAGLLRSEETIDLAVLRLLSLDPMVMQRAQNSTMIRRLWAVCQLPDYRKTAAAEHARLVTRLFDHLSKGACVIPVDMIAAEVARMDNVVGDIDTLAARISASRTWTYISHQADWLADPAHWAARTRELENKLSDALHERLIQRFVDRRTSVLMRELKMRDGVGATVAADGVVEVEGASLGTLNGFTFTADPTARHAEKRMVMAAAERALAGEMGRRATALAADKAREFSLIYEGDATPLIKWRDEPVASLKPGAKLVSPKIEMRRGTHTLSAPDKQKIIDRMQIWLDAQVKKHLGDIVALGEAAIVPRETGSLSAAARGVVVQLIEAGGCIARDVVQSLLSTADMRDRQALRKMGVRIGMMHVYIGNALKPEPTRWRAALMSLAHSGKRPAASWSGRVSIAVERDIARELYVQSGFWPVGTKAVRVDMVERVADGLRELGKQRLAFVPPDSLMSLVGLSVVEFAGLLGALGYRRRMIKTPVSDDKPAGSEIIAFQWKGRISRNVKPAKPKDKKYAVLELHATMTPKTESAFAALAALKIPAE